MSTLVIMILFFFNDTATTEIYTLSLHDALPISGVTTRNPAPPNERASAASRGLAITPSQPECTAWRTRRSTSACRSEEHTSELQSRQYLVCRLLLEKKKITQPI